MFKACFLFLVFSSYRPYRGLKFNIFVSYSYHRNSSPRVHMWLDLHRYKGVVDIFLPNIFTCKLIWSIFFSSPLTQALGNLYLWGIHCLD